MKNLVSLGDQTFYGRQRKKGESFRALNQDANVLIAVGHAALAPEKVMVQQTKQVQSRAIEAAKPEEDQEQTRSRRSYRRRDMVAEDQTNKGSDTPTTESSE